MSNIKSVGILGAGTWAVALARLLQRNGHKVTVWSKFQQEADALREHRTHPNLPGLVISEEISFTTDIQEACQCKDILIFATPSVFVRETTALAAEFIPDGQIIVDVAKGIEPETLFTMTEVIRDELRKNGKHDNIKLVSLSGPTHAEEVALDMPTSIVSACEDMDVAEIVQDAFMNSCMRTYTNADVLGVELCGALKNIMALAAGISAGLGYGDNAKAALITRGMAEITRLGLAMGCSEQTFYGLAGIGDLIVTATSRHSRNNRCGMLIGQGVQPEEAVRQVGTVEGINALPAAMQLAERFGVDMPIVTGVNAVVHGETSPEELCYALMTRDKTREVKQSEMNVRFESALQRQRMHGETRRILVGGSFAQLTNAEIVWLKHAKEQGTWLAVALTDDGSDPAAFEARREALCALRCVDRVFPVNTWADLKDAVRTLRINLVVAKPEQVTQFANEEALGVEVVTAE